jgi:dihydropteroate synthase
MPARTAPLRFFDRDSLRAQVESIRRLPLLRLFDNREMSIYLGVDRKGVAGLHLQQRRPNESVPAADDGPPVDIPLRAVPLDAR